MKIAIFEIGNYHDYPDVIRVFASVKKAMENIPSGFKKEEATYAKYYYENAAEKRWLSINEYEVEG